MSNLNYKKGKEILCGVRETLLFTFGLNAKFELICNTKKLIGTSAFSNQDERKGVHCVRHLAVRLCQFEISEHLPFPI